MVVQFVHQRTDGDFGKLVIEEVNAKEAFEDVDNKQPENV